MYVDLAGVMEGEGNGNRDEFFYFAFKGEEENLIDNLGRILGSYSPMTTKGYEIFSK